MRRWTIINVLLAVIVALLALQIVRTWARALPPIDVTPRAPAPEPAPPPAHEKGRRGAERGGTARAQQPPEALVAAIGEKDLFDPSRHAAPVEEGKPEPVRETGPPPGVTVVGVRILGSDREVFVTDASQGNAQRRLRVGDEVAGYTVKAIEPTAVTLASPSGDPVTVSLALEKGKAPGPARPVPGRPGVPAASPAAGARGLSPAAGVTATAPPAAPPVPPAVAPVPPVRQGQSPATQALPGEVRQKLEQLRRNEKRSRTAH